MLRDQITAALRDAQKAKQQRRVSTLRLILAALKDRDIAARTESKSTGVSDEEIFQMLQKMVKQRRDSIAHYEQGGRLELAEQEQQEIEIIQEFLPKQLSDAQVEEAVRAYVAEIDANGVKDMGRVMAGLKERYAGRADFGKASALVKQVLMERQG